MEEMFKLMRIRGKERRVYRDGFKKTYKQVAYSETGNNLCKYRIRLEFELDEKPYAYIYITIRGGKK